jgi:hypothetical protein
MICAVAAAVPQTDAFLLVPIGAAGIAPGSALNRICTRTAPPPDDRIDKTREQRCERQHQRSRGPNCRQPALLSIS